MSFYMAGPQYGDFFSGKRFLEGIDLYSYLFTSRKEEFESRVRSHGLTVNKSIDTDNVIFSTVSSYRATFKIEINHVPSVMGEETSYELVGVSLVEVM